MSRALAGAGAAVGLALALAGCTAAGSTVTVSGKSLNVYVSAPPPGAGTAAADVLDAEQLAFTQLSRTVSAYTLSLHVLRSSKLSDNARTAIEDSKAIAYLGEVVPGDSADSAGITNAQDLLQVSPTDTALALTQASSAVAGSPNVYLESAKTYGRTFARVVPNAAQEAKAAVQAMQKLGVKRLFASSDGSDYGRALLVVLRAAAAASSITSAPSESDADGVFYASASPSLALAFFQRASSAAPRAKLFGPSGLAGATFPASLPVYVTSPGFLPKQLPPQAEQSFVRPFEATYGHAPATEAIFGYEAMAAVLAVLHEGGTQANDRGKVVHDFFAIRGRSSVLGTYSINANGDTSIAPFVLNQSRGGRLVPARSLQAHG